MRVSAPDRPLGRLRGAATSVKHDHHQTLQRPGFLEPLDGHIHELRPAVGADLEPVERHAFLLPERFLEGAGQFVAQTFAGHGKDIPVGLAGGRFEVFAGAAADVKDVALVVDQHGRRGVTLQDQLIRQRLETGRRLWRRSRLGAGGRAGAKGRGKLDRLRPQDGLGPPEDPRFAAQRGKEIGEAANRLRAAEKQDAAGTETVVKQRNEFLLHFRRQVDQQVAAAQDVQLGEGRVHDEVLRRKDHHLADLLAHPVAVFFLDEEPAQPLRRHVGGNVVREEALAGLVDRVLVQVGGEDLQTKFPLGLSCSTASLNTMARE